MSKLENQIIISYEGKEIRISLPKLFNDLKSSFLDKFKVQNNNYYYYYGDTLLQENIYQDFYAKALRENNSKIYVMNEISNKAKSTLEKHKNDESFLEKDIYERKKLFLSKDEICERREKNENEEKNKQEGSKMESEINDLKNKENEISELKN